MNRKVVFLDIDGTLCDRSGTIPDSAMEALHGAVKNGHQMVLCTGRCKLQIFPWLNPEDFQGVVSVAGSCVTCGEHVVFQKLMERQPLRKMVHFFQDNDMPYFLQAEDAIYTDPYSASEMHDSFLEIGRSEEDVKKVLGSVSVVSDPEEQNGIEKALYYRCKISAEEVEKILDYKFTIQDSSYKMTRFCDGEVTCRGITKAAGMQHYLDYVGIPREDSIGIGDGPNDFEMLDYAGVGVAMGNGVPALKEKADYVTDKIDHDGLYKAFAHLQLI